MEPEASTRAPVWGPPADAPEHPSWAGKGRNGVSKRSQVASVSSGGREFELQGLLHRDEPAEPANRAVVHPQQSERLAGELQRLNAPAPPSATDTTAEFVAGSIATPHVAELRR